MTLEELQALREEYYGDERVYWALTIAIDLVLGLSDRYIYQDFDRLRSTSKLDTLL